MQHQLLAELFLVSFDPKIPRIGGQRKEAARRMNVSGLSHVGRSCVRRGAVTDRTARVGAYPGACEKSVWHRVVQPMDTTKHVHCLHGNCRL